MSSSDPRADNFLTFSEEVHIILQQKLRKATLTKTCGRLPSNEEPSQVEQSQV